MPPAQQGFGADHGLVGEPDLRLEVEVELVLGEGASELEIGPRRACACARSTGRKKRQMRPPSDFAW